MNLRDLLLRAARKAAAVHKEVLFSGNSKPIGQKSELSADVVTIADKESEKALRKFFSEYLPDFAIIGEEFGADYRAKKDVIVIDPLDGTWCFSQSTPKLIYEGFGTIIGIYQNSRNIAGIFHNSMSGLAYIASDGKFECTGEDASMPDTIVIAGPGLKEIVIECERLFKEAFPDKKIIGVYKHNLAATQQILYDGRICAGKMAARFHTGIAWHDISPLPVFRELTGTCITDHRGRPYQKFDIQKEKAKYNSMDQKTIYSHPLLIAHPEYHDKMIRIVERFAAELDKIQNPPLS